MKYLGINQTKYVQDLYKEYYKYLMNNIEELSKWKDIPYSWIGRFNIVKYQLFPTWSIVSAHLYEKKLICGYKQILRFQGRAWQNTKSFDVVNLCTPQKDIDKCKKSEFLYLQEDKVFQLVFKSKDQDAKWPVGRRTGFVKDWCF